MPAGRVRQLARLGAGLRGFLAETVEPVGAARRTRQRLERREQRFLDAAASLVYANERSPYRRLLSLAGCEHGDLVAAVRREGLEATLDRLRREGVSVSLAELKGEQPIVRAGETIEARQSDFDSPLLLGRGVAGKTSGSRSSPARVQYDWRGLAEEADVGMVLEAVHGVADAPLALWFPAPPGVAGLRNVLLSAKCARPAERWFSHSASGWRSGGPLPTISLRFLRWQAGRLGMRIPAPEHTPPADAIRVARWLAPRSGDPRPRTLRTMTSSATRIARAALEAGISLDPGVALVGGEPIAAEQRELIESAGLRAVNRYATAEAGIVAAGCGRERSTDAMHLYTDRVAAVQGEDGVLLTSLSRYAGKVLLNASLGDHGELDHRRCDCALGGLGMDTWISRLGSEERLTIEGMTMRLADLHAIIARVLASRGADPGECQLWKLAGPDGAKRLAVAVAPRVGLDREALLAAIFAELSRQGELGRLTATVWAQAGALEVVEAEPRLSAGHKLLPVAAAR